MRMRIVVLDHNIFVAEGEEIADVRVDHKPRQWARYPRKLLTRLIEVIPIKMSIAECMNKLTNRETDRLSGQVGQ